MTAVAFLVASAGALAAAPLLLPSSFSWIEHTTSESGAQGVAGAWLARAGFVLFGLGAGAVTLSARSRWNPVALVAHGGFAVSMLAVAAFSTRSWTGAAYDALEDTLHSIAATTMGFCFVIGVLAVFASRERSTRGALDCATIGVATAAPIAMTAWESGAGMLQRSMFVVAYVWYLGEVRTGGRTSRRGGRPW